MLMLATTAAMIEQFNKNNILILESLGYEVHVAGNWKEGNPISEERLDEFKGWLSEHHGKWFHIPSTRKPTDIKNNGKALKQIVDMIHEYEYEFIHCHTPIGSVIGRLAALKTHTKIIYTAHGFHFFKGAPLKNWLLYYPAEWICSWMTDILITINKEDYARAKKHLHAKRVEYIPGVGVDVEKFASCKVDKKEKCKELGIPDDKFILLSVGELQTHKNQRLVLETLGEIKNLDIYYLVVGQGVLRGEYENKVEQYGLEKNIKLLGYRKDVNELCKIADCFVHPSFREGLGIAPLEAMACGLPLISSYIGGMKDYTIDGKSGCCINPKSKKDMIAAISKMYQNKDFRIQCGRNNQATVNEFDLKIVQQIMKKLYQKNIDK